jgi:hypothetical protein
MNWHNADYKLPPEGRTTNSFRISSVTSKCPASTALERRPSLVIPRLQIRSALAFKYLAETEAPDD